MKKTLLFLTLIAPAGFAVQPSFPCTGAFTNAVEVLICKEDTLAKLDVKMKQAYDTVVKSDMAQSDLKIQQENQRNWLKKRDQCATSSNVSQCVDDSYSRRISELQVVGGMMVVPAPHIYNCGKAGILTAYFYNKTLMPVAMLNIEDKQAMGYITRSGSGVHYETDDNWGFWSKGKNGVLMRNGAKVAECKETTPQ